MLAEACCKEDHDVRTRELDGKKWTKTHLEVGEKVPFVPVANQNVHVHLVQEGVPHLVHPRANQLGVLIQEAVDNHLGRLGRVEVGRLQFGLIIVVVQVLGIGLVRPRVQLELGVNVLGTLGQGGEGAMGDVEEIVLVIGAQTGIGDRVVGSYAGRGQQDQGQRPGEDGGAHDGRSRDRRRRG